MKKLILSVLSVILILLVIIFCLSEISDVLDVKSLFIKKNNCQTIYHEVGEKNIILRIDDIQACAYSEAQYGMLEELEKRNLTASLAVIPLNLLKDEKAIKYLSEHRCKFELGLHGYYNTDYEFENLSYAEADKLIKKGLRTLNKIEPEVFTFIPPNNEISEEAKMAVWDNGIEIISAGHWNSEYGFSISSYDWRGEQIRDAQEVLKECQEDLDKYKTCIIMLHPQDYMTDGKLNYTKYNEYIELLDGLEKLNASIVNFRDLYRKDFLVLN